MASKKPTPKPAAKKPTPKAAPAAVLEETATDDATQEAPAAAVGDTVNYHTHAGAHAAQVAHVVDAETGRCNLAFLTHEGATLPALDVPYSTEPEPGTWTHR